MLNVILLVSESRVEYFSDAVVAVVVCILGFSQIGWIGALIFA